MTAVVAMATVPQNMTRSVGLRMLAPPARAPMAPSAASPTRQASDTLQTTVPAGESSATISGNAAPDAKVAADVIAAWTGLAIT